MLNIQLNKTIHEQARLKILVLLASSKTESIPFAEIKQELNFTAGNLSIQLKTLEEAGYITTEKLFAGNKPRTNIAITTEGRSALVAYMEDLQKVISSLNVPQ